MITKDSPEFKKDIFLLMFDKSFPYLKVTNIPTMLFPSITGTDIAIKGKSFIGSTDGSEINELLFLAAVKKS
ncbi:hypothetical protein CNEONATNEC26_03243 [Clostridium neonatale]|nr:hypothetical protein CNEONATNEC26_03243 [Clostridium neonatale]